MRCEPAVTLHTVCGLDELAGHGARGVSHVLSLLDPGTPEPAAFSAYGAHARTTLRFHDCLGPGAGLVPPEPEHIAAILGFGRDLDGAGHLLVHCHYGLSRSTAALLILLAQNEPESPAEVLVARLHALREPAWPNARMIGFADAMLSREGRLSEAVRRLHALQLRVRPHLAELLRGLGRGAEVDAAGVADPFQA
ncbi:tyrosine phosphatase family protein [Methylobacterium sp. NEAU K]|uniref:tyrosine phosphatase family protein n=1 Tax=Methylobacterium sp. NEAU K TaxID=3064946 RepID=UPI002736C1AE|nr:protein-tyrosine-phosphatase [Methylobacterium sp. NEAU K]MDP4006801.1 protein-tyrosine-phosphatase [Methylobacterium sp. NEAU K]